jgi:hypothetical protein
MTFHGCIPNVKTYQVEHFKYVQFIICKHTYVILLKRENVIKKKKNTALSNGIGNYYLTCLSKTEFSNNAENAGFL